MEREADFFDGNIANIQMLAIDFLGNESVCDHAGCTCGMELPWAVIAECGTDTYDVTEEDEELEETNAQVVTRACSVEAALVSIRAFEDEHNERWSIILTDAAHAVFKLEASFREGLKTGNLNWEDIIFDDDSDEKS